MHWLGLVVGHDSTRCHERERAPRKTAPSCGTRSVVLVVLGLVVAFAGLTLTVAPLAAIRLANTLRFLPSNTSEEAVRYYRMSGMAMLVIGLILAVLMT